MEIKLNPIGESTQKEKSLSKTEIKHCINISTSHADLIDKLLLSLEK